MKKLILLFSVGIILSSCGGGVDKKQDQEKENELMAFEEARRDAGYSFENIEKAKTSESEIYEVALGVDAEILTGKMEQITRVQNDSDDIEMDKLQKDLDEIHRLKNEVLPIKSTTKNIDLYFLSREDLHRYVVIKDGKIDRPSAKIMNYGVIGSRSK